MYGENVVECEVNPPDYATQTQDHQCPVNQCTESYFSKLNGNVSFKNITDRMESGIIRIADEVYTDH